ncbi:MAG: 2-C-methyl-D-erythritol 4-phosphate cytidylyltransferase [Pseudomonadota bacterium]
MIALIPPAGHGARFGGEQPKHYAAHRGPTVIDHTLDRITRCPGVERTRVALAADDPGTVVRGWAQVETVIGGADRARSVLALLDAVADLPPVSWVLVHDAARPCVTVADVLRLRDAVLQSDADGGILATRVRDTVKRVDTAGHVVQTVPRDDLWGAATPQLFRLGPLRDAVHGALVDGVAVTDEASAMEWAGHRVRVVAGRDDNIKVTRPGDLSLAASILEQQADEPAGGAP